MRRRYHFCGGVAAYLSAGGSMDTQDFDALMAFLCNDVNTKSARVTKADNAAPMGAAHVELDGKEYMVMVVPTDLEPVG